METRRRHHVGLVQLRSRSEPVLLRHRQPRVLESRPAARRQQMVDDDLRGDPDTGKAKWAYQKTPHDAWDYDGINENVLVDINIKGQMKKALVNFDRNGFSYTLDSAT